MLALDSDASFFTGSNMSWQHDMTLLPSCLAFYIVLATLKIHDNKKFRHGASGDIQHVKCQARQAATFADVKESTDKITYIISKGIQAMQLILSMFAFCMFCWVDKIVHHFYSCVRLQVTILLYLKQYTYHLHGEGRKQLNCDFGNPLCRSRPSSGALSYAETTPWVMNLEEEMPLECRSCGVQHRFFTSTTWSSFREVKMIAAMNDGRHRGFQKLRYHGRRQRLKKIHYSCRRQKFRKINYLWNHKKKIILQKYKRKQFKVDGSKNGFLNMVITIKQFFLPLYVEVMKYESYVYLNLADLIQLFSIEIIYKKLVFETHKMPRQVPLDRGSTPPRESSRRRYPSRHRGNETRNERQSNKRMDGKNMLRKVSCDCRCTKRSSKYAFSSSRIARQQPPKTFWAFIKDSITDKVVKKAPRKPPRKKLIVMSDKPKPFRNVSVESSKIYDAPSLKDKTKHVFEKILFDSKGRETSRLSYHSNVKAEPDTGREKSIHVVHPPVRRERRNEQNRDSSQSDNISKISSSCPNISRERSKGKTLASEEQKDAKNSEKSPGTSDTKRSTETDYSNSTVESTEEAKDTNDVKLDGNEQTPGETEDKNGNKSEEIAQGGTSQNEPKSTVRENVLQPASAALKECPLKECPCMASATMRNDTSISGTMHSGLHQEALITSVEHNVSQNRLPVVNRESHPQTKSSDKQVCMKRKESVVNSTIQEGPNASGVNQCNNPQTIVVQIQQTDTNRSDEPPSSFVKQRQELRTLNERHYKVQGQPRVSSKHSYVGNEVYLGAEISLSSLSTQQWPESRSGISSHSHFRSRTPIKTRVFGESRRHKYNYHYYPAEDLHRQHGSERNYAIRSHRRNYPVISVQQPEEYTDESGGRPLINEVIYEDPKGHVQFVVDNSRKRLQRRDLGAVRHASRGKYTEARIFHTTENAHHTTSRSSARVEKIRQALESAILYGDNPPRNMVTVKEPYRINSYHVSNACRSCLLKVNECDDDCARSRNHYTKRNISRKTPKVFIQQTVLESAPKDHQYKSRDHYSEPRESSYGKQYDRILPRYAPNEHIHGESAAQVVNVPIKLHKCIERKLPSEKQHLERKKDDFMTSDNSHRHSVSERKVSYHHNRPPNISSSGSETELSVVGISGKIIRVSSKKRMREKTPDTIGKIERIVHSSDKQSEHLRKERICSIHIYKNNNEIHLQPSDITVSATGSSTFYNVCSNSSVNIVSTDNDDGEYNFSVEMFSGNESAHSTSNFRTLDVNSSMHYVQSDMSVRDIAPTYYKAGTNTLIIDEQLQPDFDKGKYGNQEVQHHYRCLTGPQDLEVLRKANRFLKKSEKQHEMLLFVGEAHVEEEHGSKAPKFSEAFSANSSNGSLESKSADIVPDFHSKQGITANNTTQ